MVHDFALLESENIGLGTRIWAHKYILAGAHSVVTKDVDAEMLVVGNPAKVRCSVRDIRDENGNQIYPWKNHLKEYRGYPWQIKE